MSATSSRTFWLLLIVAAVLLPLALPGLPLFDQDEGAYSEATREMLASGNYLVVSLNGEVFWDKPILMYWLQGLSVALLGVNTFAFRVPSMLAALFTAFLLARFVDRYVAYAPTTRPLPVASGRPGLSALPAWLSPGLLAGIMFLTSAGHYMISRSATADALLQLFISGAAFSLWEGFVAVTEVEKRRAHLKLFAWVALGFLTKGPIAAVIPGVAGAALYALHGRLTDALKLAVYWRGWLVLLLIAGPWLGAVLYVHGQEFIDKFVLQQNMGRFSQAMQGHSGSIFYYVPVLLVLAMPFTGLVLAAFRGLRRFRADALDCFLWSWFLFVLVFFSLAATKLPHYLLYGVVPLWVLVLRHATQFERIGTAAILCVPVILFVLLAVVPSLVPHLDMPKVARYVVEDIDQQVAPWWPWLMVLIIVAYGVAAWRWRAMPLAVLAGAGVVSALLLALFVFPFAGHMQQAPALAGADFARAQGKPLVLWTANYPSVAVHLQQIVPKRPPQEGELALMRRDRIPPGHEILFVQRQIAVVRPCPGKQCPSVHENSMNAGAVTAPDQDHPENSR